MSMAHMIRTIRAEFPDVDGDDTALQVRILQRFYHAQSIEDLLRPGMPKLETIRRTRQKIDQGIL